MTKAVNDSVLDGALNVVKTTGTRLCVCSALPTTYAEATTTYDGGASKYKLAIKTISATDFTGPADGAGGDGRKLTVNQQTGVTVDATATALYIAVCDSVLETVLIVTTCTSQALTSGNTVTIPAFIETITDPT
jgi:hypothetical protein